MKYAVIVTPEAEKNIEAAFSYIYDRSTRNAGKWIRGLYHEIDSLELFPHRCGIAPDSRFVGEELRHLIYKSHRVIFRIEERHRIVRVLHVRHAARRAWGEATPREEDAGEE